MQSRLSPSYIPGKLIAAEGLDGSGKSTQIYLIKRWLELEGYKVAFTEWNSSSLVKDATRKGKKRQILTPTTFSLIHSTDFADRYERQILPLLRAGYIVLADRYVYTAFARDAVRSSVYIRRADRFMSVLCVFFGLIKNWLIGQIRSAVCTTDEAANFTQCRI